MSRRAPMTPAERYEKGERMREMPRQRDLAVKCLSHTLAALTDWPHGGIVGAQVRSDGQLASALLNTTAALMYIVKMDGDEMDGDGHARRIVETALRAHVEQHPHGQHVGQEHSDGGG